MCAPTNVHKKELTALVTARKLDIEWANAWAPPLHMVGVLDRESLCASGLSVSPASRTFPSEGLSRDMGAIPGHRRTLRRSAAIIFEGSAKRRFFQSHRGPLLSHLLPSCIADYDILTTLRNKRT